MGTYNWGNVYVGGGLISGSYKWNGIFYEFYEPLSILCTNNESRNTQQHFIQRFVKVKKPLQKPCTNNLAQRRIQKDRSLARGGPGLPSTPLPLQYLQYSGGENAMTISWP